jgi:predicted RNA binding protein YcfA (HicA-like mRNA interferase family)
VTSVDKIVAKIRQQSNGIGPDEAGSVLDHYGYKFDRQNGSYKTYINEAGDIQTVPKKRPIVKSIYVKQILSKIGD